MKPIPADNLFDQLSEAAKDELRTILKRDRIFRETREDLYCNTRYDGFFSHFSDESVREFIDEYALRKAHYLVNGEQHVHAGEAAQLHFRQQAEACFWEIQQKKLFDRQCLWRAGKIELPGIEVTRDFHVEEIMIRACRLITPVTREELNLYIDYLHSAGFDPRGARTRWQDYETIRSGWQPAGETVPAWYTFYDEAIGSGQLLALPDRKGEKEAACLEAARADGGDDSPSGNGNHKPGLKADYKTLEFFIATFEDKAMAKYFGAIERHHPDISDHASVDEAVRILSAADEPVPLRAGEDWKQALLDAADRYNRRKTAAALGNVFHEYQLRLQAGLSFGADTDPALIDILRARIRRYKDLVLQGRRNLGEPADFDY